MPSKICSVCKKDKDVTEFCKAPKNKNLKYGVSYRCKDCDSANSKRWREANKKKVQKKSRDYHLMTNYGLTSTQYEEMVKQRDGRCDCCGEKADDQAKPPVNKLMVDHCHETGVIRGLLCHRCNLGIGILGDTLDHAEAAVKYLKRSLDEEKS